MNGESLFRSIGELDDSFILEAEAPIKKHKLFFKVIGAMAACIAIIFFVKYQHLYSTLELPKKTDVTIVNPAQNQASIKELSETLGFEVLLPEVLPKGYAPESYTALADTLAEVHYTDGTNTLTYRMAHIEEDISGDFKTYDVKKNLLVGDTEITLKGDNTSIYSAIWKSNGFSFSLASENGLSDDIFISIIESITKKMEE